MNLLQKKEPNPPPWRRSWAQDNSSRAAGQWFLEKIQNGEGSFTLADFKVSSEEGHSITLLAHYIFRL